MAYTKTIACLANSRKPPSGRCIAGREFANGRLGAWVRPVSARASAEISEDERRYQNGEDPKVLDVISIQMLKPVPHLHQQENHVIDDSVYWQKVGTVTWEQLQDAVEDPAGPLWLNNSSSRHGLNDRVAESELAKLKRSLYLIRPNDAVVAVALEGGELEPARRRVRVRFSVCGHDYKLSVTDPVVEKEFLAGEDGETKLGDVMICVSLGESYHGNAYKLAAAIVTRRRAEA